MTTEQLKPCPFCNADMSSFVQSAEGFCHGEGSTLYVPCDCGAMGPEGKTIDDAIAAWNRRTPVEQLSAQTAAKTEQPSLSDARIDEQIVHFAKLYAWGLSCGQFDTLREYTHQVTRALLAQRQDSEQSRLMLADDTSPRIPQRQDSNKDAERLDWLLDWYLRDGMRAEIDPLGHIRRTTKEIILAAIDRVIANGAPK